MNQSLSVVKTPPRRYLLSSVVLGAGFSLTGTGTLMLGVLLPVLAARWGLRDSQSGLLLFMQFLGSSLGAVLTGKDRLRALVTGYGLLIASGFLLVAAGPHTAYAAFFFWGLGLGMSMTSTNLIISDRAGEHRAVHLERLNFAWSSGAAAAPFLFVPFLRGAGFHILVFIFQALFLLLLLWSILGERRQARPRFETLLDVRAPGGAVRGAFVPLIILAACAVGIETALGGWLTTYSHRADPHGAEAEVLAAGFFLTGLVVSRLVFSTRLLAALGRRRVLRVALWSTVVATALVVVWQGGVALDVVAALGGFSLGPIYPLALSYLLELSPRGWVFAAGGAGAAFFPWLTGALSSAFGALRYGLIAPCTAALLMIALSAAALREHSPVNVDKAGEPQSF